MEQNSESWTEAKNRQVYRARDPYRIISLSLREKLIQMVCQEGISVYKACKQVRVNYSTGKSIVKQFKTKGRVYKRKQERKDEEAHVASPPVQTPNISQQEEIPQQPESHPILKVQFNEGSYMGCYGTPSPCYHNITPNPVMLYQYNVLNFSGMPGFPYLMGWNDLV